MGELGTSGYILGVAVIGVIWVVTLAKFNKWVASAIAVASMAGWQLLWHFSSQGL